MTTDLHGGHGADAPAAPHPDTLPDPDGSNLLPVPSPFAAADTALLPAVVDEDATSPASPEATLPEPFPEPDRPADCVVGPLAAISDLCRWLSEAAARAGEPSSLSLSSGGREATVHFATSATFLEWCHWYGIREWRYTRDVLGDAAEGIITISGWVLRLRLSGPAVEELP